MCRWAAYIGEPIMIEDIVTAPQQSLIRQSLRAEQSVTEVNADGFGMAWYGERVEPGLYRDVMPAWSDANLRSIASQVRSGLFMAHVRASTESATSRNNCHPFAVGPWSFMHNGQVGGFGRFRRRVDMAIPDGLYDQRKGATDSEALFLLAFAAGLDRDPKLAMEHAVGQLLRLARDAGEEPNLRMTAALSDGRRLFAVRYASDPNPPSLYHHSEAGGRSVVSEPLDHRADDWEEIAPATWVEIQGDTVRTEAFSPAI